MNITNRLIDRDGTGFTFRGAIIGIILCIIMIHTAFKIDALETSREAFYFAFISVCYLGYILYESGYSRGIRIGRREKRE